MIVILLSVLACVSASSDYGNLCDVDKISKLTVKYGGENVDCNSVLTPQKAESPPSVEYKTAKEVG